MFRKVKNIALLLITSAFFSHSILASEYSMVEGDF